LRCWC